MKKRTLKNKKHFGGADATKGHSVSSKNNKENNKENSKKKSKKNKVNSKKNEDDPSTLDRLNHYLRRGNNNKETMKKIGAALTGIGALLLVKHGARKLYKKSQNNKGDKSGSDDQNEYGGDDPNPNFNNDDEDVKNVIGTILKIAKNGVLEP
jgi:hypothetical protein